MKLRGHKLRGGASLSAIAFLLFACAGATARGRAGATETADAARARASAAAESVRPAGEVLVVLNEGMLDALLDAVVSQPNPPKFPLSKGGSGGGGCASEISPARESGGKKTAVTFRDGRVTAQIAFRGSYSTPLFGCLKFEGWADTVFNLAFDPARQALTARVEVREVQLRNVPSALGGGITGLVQDALDERINPVEILRAEQLGARIPVARGDNLRLRAREVRHEVAGPELCLRIVYEIVRVD